MPLLGKNPRVEDMNGRTVVVSNDCGFIDTDLAQTLSKKNQIIVVDDISTRHLENIQNLNNSQNTIFVKDRVTEIDILQTTFGEIDYVFFSQSVLSRFVRLRIWCNGA